MAIETNAVLAKERHAVELVERYMGAAAMPCPPLALSIIFDCRSTDCATHKMQIKFLRGVPAGTISLRFNALFLQQAPAVFFREVIPHEIAHVAVAYAAAYAGSSAPPPHGDEWTRILLQLRGDIVPQPSLATYFDARAIRLHKGAIAARCQCAGDVGFSALAHARQTGAIKSEPEKCAKCEAIFKPSAEPYPEKVRDELQFIRQHLCLN